MSDSKVFEFLQNRVKSDSYFDISRCFRGFVDSLRHSFDIFCYQMGFTTLISIVKVAKYLRILPREGPLFESQRPFGRRSLSGNLGGNNSDVDVDVDDDQTIV